MKFKVRPPPYPEFFPAVALAHASAGLCACVFHARLFSNLFAGGEQAQRAASPSACPPAPFVIRQNPREDGVLRDVVEGPTGEHVQPHQVLEVADAQLLPVLGVACHLEHDPRAQ